MPSAAASWQGSIRSCADAVRSRAVSATTVAASVIEELVRQEPTLQAFTHWRPDDVIAQAERIDSLVAQNKDPGPLAGVPIGVKDLFDVEGYPTSYGSASFAPYLAARDATAVGALRKAGAILVGKTRTSELAWSTTTPPTSNPVDPTRVAGGSSGGSAAAVGAGCVYGALGTDTGGSIRIPASLCGVVGLKPTYGLVGRTGILPANWSLDTAGPLARSVADCRALLAAMCEPDPGDAAAVSADRLASVRASLVASQTPPPPVRVGVIDEPLFEILEPEIESLFERTLTAVRDAGVEIVKVPLPEAEWVPAALIAVDLPEGAAIHTERLRELGDLIGPDVRSLLTAAHFIPGAAVARGHAARRMIRDAVASCFHKHGLDAFLTPTNPAVAVRHDDTSLAYERRDGSSELAIWSYARTCWLANLTGQPALSLPLPATALPVGVQLIGRPFQEARLLQIAEHLEHAIRGSAHPEEGA